VRDTPQNRWLTANSAGQLLGWTVVNSDAVAAIGVAEEPAPSVALNTLRQLAVRSAEFGDQDADRAVMTAARTCYELLARALRSDHPYLLDDEPLEHVLRREFSIDATRGLIFVPPPSGVMGTRWWSPTRVIQENQFHIAGPFLGYLAGRYRRATALWEVLAIPHDLTLHLIRDVIADDLPKSPAPEEVVAGCYGRLVAALDGMPLDDSVGHADIPAFTQHGWAPPEDVFWTNRPEIETAFGDKIQWWRPGGLEPSTVHNASHWLGVHELLSDRQGGALHERWRGLRSEAVSMEVAARWNDALSVWYGRLRAANSRFGAEVDREIWASIFSLTPEIAPNMKATFTINRLHGGPISSTAHLPARVLMNDGVILASSADTLFSRAAAEVIAAYAPVPRLQATDSLTGILLEARQDPASLERQLDRYGSSPDSAPARFSETEDDDTGSLDPTRLTSIKGEETHHEGPEAQHNGPQESDKKSDPSQYVVTSIVTAPPAIPGNNEVERSTELRSPQISDDKEGDVSPHRGARPAERYSTKQIEDAGTPYIAQFERLRGNYTLTKQGPAVGYDFVSSREGTIDRCIEMKVSSGKASDEFELTWYEYRAATHPELGERYWVYIVEHALDDNEPVVTAIFNPVRDEGVVKEPAGDVKIRGWRYAAIRFTGTTVRLKVDNHQSTADTPT
jgi:hypothetical protein